MKKRLLLVLVTLLFIVLPLCEAKIIGRIGNAITILRPEVQTGETKIIERSILVRNVNNFSVNITLDTDEGLKDIVTIIDKEFALLPGESRNAQFIITLTDTYTYNGRIVVSFTPPEGPGIKMSSKITIVGTGPKPGEEPTPDEEPEEFPEEMPEEFPEDVDLPGESEVNFSIGSTGGAVAEDENNKKPNPIIGATILLSIVLIGSLIFFIIRTRVRK